MYVFVKIINILWLEKPWDRFFRQRIIRILLNALFKLSKENNFSLFSHVSFQDLSDYGSPQAPDLSHFLSLFVIVALARLYIYLEALCGLLAPHNNSITYNMHVSLKSNYGVRLQSKLFFNMTYLHLRQYSLQQFIKPFEKEMPILLKYSFVRNKRGILYLWWRWDIFI